MCVQTHTDTKTWKLSNIPINIDQNVLRWHQQRNNKTTNHNRIRPQWKIIYSPTGCDRLHSIGWWSAQVNQTTPISSICIHLFLEICKIDKIEKEQPKNEHKRIFVPTLHGTFLLILSQKSDVLLNFVCVWIYFNRSISMQFIIYRWATQSVGEWLHRSSFRLHVYNTSIFGLVTIIN